MNPIRHPLLAAVLASAVAACAPPYDPKKPTVEPSQAPQAGAVADAGIEAIRERVRVVLPNIRAEDIRPADAPGLYEIQQGALFGYVTADGRYLIEGDLIDLTQGVSLTENKRKRDRIVKLEALGEDNMIVFGPQNGKARYAVTVFTDIDCGYCRKLHREIDEYTKRGIEIRYVFYPRSGPDTESFRKAQAVWCAADRKQALTQAKAGMPVTGDANCDNPVEREWMLGAELGLRGTPMLVLPDGEVVNGYLPAAVLAERLASRG